ncbi:MAG: phosphodiester glycosidase family protein [Bacteroidetes bacterium]|nr:phosphodiester glycosidase family protein [Bacteroidota bacterium]
MSFRKAICLLVTVFSAITVSAQLKWKNVDSLYQPLPLSVHIYFTDDKPDTAAFKAYYLIADLKDKSLAFTVDTTLNRRLTPQQFSERNKKAIAVVNCTFFSFATNRNLNVVVRNNKLVSFAPSTVENKGKDTLTYRHYFSSAFGIDKKRNAEIAWLYADSSMRVPLATQCCPIVIKDSTARPGKKYLLKDEYVHTMRLDGKLGFFKKWKMQTAVGGGPVLVQNGEIVITNNEELKFSGKAINDKHPRTAMGYTNDDKLIILVVEGRNKSAAGATLTQEAQILKDLGCVEALNLDGGGSSCMVVNGKETIKVSDATGQRPVPAVFMIMKK